MKLDNTDKDCNEWWNSLSLKERKWVHSYFWDIKDAHKKVLNSFSEEQAIKHHDFQLKFM